MLEYTRFDNSTYDTNISCDVLKNSVGVFHCLRTEETTILNGVDRFKMPFPFETIRFNYGHNFCLVGVVFIYR